MSEYDEASKQCHNKIGCITAFACIHDDQPAAAGAAMSPGSQMRALTEKSAKANKSTIKIGRSVDRKNVMAGSFGLVIITQVLVTVQPLPAQRPQPPDHT